jgi:hypothetical protein
VVRTTTPALRVRAASSMAMAGLLYGAGAGLYQPALMAYLVDRIDPCERGRALATFALLPGLSRPPPHWHVWLKY